MSFVVAIDGPAASGKGTISHAVAARFGFAHLDTGLLYRAVGRKALSQMGPALGDEAALIDLARGITQADIDRDDLRTAAVAEAASRVATIGGLREALVQFQRDFSARPGGTVLDGRDIGTVICPDADVKLFVTASAETRAQRRFDELAGRGEDTSFEAVLADVKSRDARDAGRSDAPMIAAEDAISLDTSEMSIAEAVAAAIEIIDRHHRS